jgi:hypothetical protein
MKSILDPTFNYVPSVQTDIRKTFARLRRQQHEARSERSTVHSPCVLPILFPAAYSTGLGRAKAETLTSCRKNGEAIYPRRFYSCATGWRHPVVRS